jgi:hypothetical protein
MDSLIDYCHARLQKHSRTGYSVRGAWVGAIKRIKLISPKEVEQIIVWAWNDHFWQERISSPHFMERNWPIISRQYHQAQARIQRTSGFNP